MNTRTQHVVPHGQQWAVQSEGSKRVTVFETKSEAIDAARQIAAKIGVEFLVHGKNGQIFYRSELPTSLDEDKLREVVRKNSGLPSSRTTKSKTTK